jgi:hypothetical protein
VAWMTINAYGEEDDIHYENPEGHLLEGWTYRPLYTHPLSVQPQPVKLRRGDILRCIETDELCTVWSTSTTGKTLVKWGANDFGSYTAEQIGELFWLEPKLEQEPVAWMHTMIDDVVIGHRPADLNRHPERWKPLVYANTAPPAAPAQPEQPEQEPVAWLCGRPNGDTFALTVKQLRELGYGNISMPPFKKLAPLFTALEQQALAHDRMMDDALTIGSAWSRGGERIDPTSVYKDIGEGA